MSIDGLQNLMIMYRKIIKITHSIEYTLVLGSETKSPIENKCLILTWPFNSETGIKKNYYRSGVLFTF